MGVLNCQKCINSENRIINELLLEGKERKKSNIVTALKTQDTDSSPQKLGKYFTEMSINRLTQNDNKESQEHLIKRVYLEIKKGNTDAIYDLDYNTLDIICNDSDSYQDFFDKKSEKYINMENNNINLNINKNIKNKEDMDEFHKILLAGGNNDLNINDFINQKIKESQDAMIQEKENINNNEIMENPDNYKIIYDKNLNNYPNNYKYNNFSDLELSDEESFNNKKNKIIEEKEEYENENEESSFQKFKELKHNSAQLNQNKVKSLEINKSKKYSKSEKIKNKGDESNKENQNNINSINLNNNAIYKQQGGKSVTSYELESDNSNLEIDD